MLIRLMKVFEYNGTGRICKESRVVDPTWDQVEEAVRRLDKFTFPFVWFYLLEKVADNVLPAFMVIGGTGDFCMASSVDGRSQRRFRDPTHGKAEIDLWTSDQGCSMAEEYVCHDVELVLTVLRHFNMTGQFSPEVSWE